MKTLNFRSNTNKCRLEWIDEIMLVLWIGKKEFHFSAESICSIFFSETFRDKIFTTGLNIIGSDKEILEVSVGYPDSIRIFDWLHSIVPLAHLLGKKPIQPPTKKTSKLNNKTIVIIAIAFLVVLLFFIFNHYKPFQFQNLTSQNNQTVDSSGYKELLEQGVKLIEKNQLTDGINLLLQAKAINPTPEIDAELNKAYFERGEYFFQNNVYEKAFNDFENMFTLTPQAQEMMSQMRINTSDCLPGVDAKNIQEMLKESYFLTFSDPRKISSGNWVVDGIMSDDDTNSNLICKIYLKNPQEIYRVVFETDASCATEKPKDYSFEKLSTNYLGFAGTLFNHGSDPVKASEWIVKTVPKAKLSYVQFDNVFVTTCFRLSGEQYKRTLEIFPAS
jgi:tetratricopeptide (TPR) repeat protein